MTDLTIKIEMTRKEKEIFSTWLMNAMENYWPEGWTDAKGTWTREEYEVVQDIHGLITDWYDDDQDHAYSLNAIKHVFGEGGK